MKNSLRFAALTALISATALSSQAQTNRVESLDFQLTAYSQAVPGTNSSDTNATADVVRVGTRDIIHVLGVATSNDFSKGAELLRVTSIANDTNAGTTIVIQDGTNTVNVTGFFAYSLDGVVVSNQMQDRKGKLIEDTRYSVRTLSLQDQTGYPTLNAHFTIQGFDISSYYKIVLKDGKTVKGHNAVWLVNGTGDYEGNPTLLQGQYTVNYDKIVIGSHL